MAISELPFEFCKLMNNMEIETSMMSRQQTDQQRTQSVLDQKLFNIKRKMESRFDST